MIHIYNSDFEQIDEEKEHVEDAERAISSTIEDIQKYEILTPDGARALSDRLQEDIEAFEGIFEDYKEAIDTLRKKLYGFKS